MVWYLDDFGVRRQVDDPREVWRSLDPRRQVATNRPYVLAVDGDGHILDLLNGAKVKMSI
jgi:hypothetical protein